MTGLNILVIRLGAMGDIIHTLPAVASLRQSFPHCAIVWAVEPRWMPLLEGNPCVDDILPVNRHSLSAIVQLRQQMRKRRFERAIDFQGLIKSSAVAMLSGAKKIYGLHRSAAREPLAALAYSHTCKPQALHIIDRHLELAACAGAPAAVRVYPLPPGQHEGVLPDGPFVLANADAGWPAKEWPREDWSELAHRLESCGCA
ncbi:MAG TPA: glycosyltransferase family 9 protein, partial [Bryobacteraceae bacterium]|nr:glycosyltransferase family 9 protein [Bryobacteraceae bacterium]